MTVVGSVPHSPESITASSWWSSRSLISQPCGHRLVVAGQQQRAGQQRLAQLGQQRLRHGVVRDAHADGLLLAGAAAAAAPPWWPAG